MSAVRLGMLTPSSNTVLEPMCAEMLRGVDDVSVHFARFRVLRIALEEAALAQFTPEPMMAAAGLLADAKVDAICWNGTSAGWLGFGSDEALCAAITEATGTPASTSVMALNEALEAAGAKRIAFVTPYLDEIQSAIVRTYESAGYDVVAEAHLGDPGNWSFATYSEEKITEMCRRVAVAKPDAISVFCTNFRGAGVAEAIEAEMGIPVFDTVSTAVWKSMLLAGADPSAVRGWGRLFELTPHAT